MCCEGVDPSTLSAFAVNCRHINIVKRIHNYWLWNKMYYRTSTKRILQIRHLLSYLGAFPWATAGKFQFSSIVTLCIALTNTPNLDRLLQRNGGPYNSFTLGSFQFNLTSPSSGHYFRYTIIFGDVPIPFILLPVDRSTECGPHSNLNFVQFIGKYFDIYSFRKYAIIAFPPESPGVLNPKHHTT
jgi:hypothetical protein